MGCAARNAPRTVVARSGASVRKSSVLKRFGITDAQQVKPIDATSKPYVDIFHGAEEHSPCTDVVGTNCSAPDDKPVAEIVCHENGVRVY
jgi:hypothetical protein